MWARIVGSGRSALHLASVISPHPVPPEVQLLPPSEARDREDGTTGVVRVTRALRDVASFGSLKGLEG